MQRGISFGKLKYKTTHKILKDYKNSPYFFFIWCSDVVVYKLCKPSIMKLSESVMTHYINGAHFTWSEVYTVNSDELYFNLLLTYNKLYSLFYNQTFYLTIYILLKPDTLYEQLVYVSQNTLHEVQIENWTW